MENSNQQLIQNPSKIIKIAIVGAECTGKTTLCQALADYYDTNWVAESMRTYLQDKWDNYQKSCEWDDLLPIAIGQINDENRLSESANRYLFCDTCLFELMTYSYLYYNDCPSQIEWGAMYHHYDVWLLTDIDVKWVADDLRDKPNERVEVLDFFKQKLNQFNKPYHLISGSVESRVAQVATILNELTHNR